MTFSKTICTIETRVQSSLFQNSIRAAADTGKRSRRWDFLEIFLEKEKEESGKITCKDKTIYSPLAGTVIPLAEVEDPVFSQGMMGLGVGIIPAEGKLYAPADGTVAAVFPTGHAVGMETEDGMELLLHIGIDTVEMKGKGFKAVVAQGAKVKAGDLLVEFEPEVIKAAGYKDTTMVLVSNAAMMGEMSDPVLGAVKPLDELFSFH